LLKENNVNLVILIKKFKMVDEEWTSQNGKTYWLRKNYGEQSTIFFLKSKKCQKIFVNAERWASNFEKDLLSWNNATQSLQEKYFWMSTYETVLINMYILTLS
jgi:hypothetical protein